MTQQTEHRIRLDERSVLVAGRNVLYAYGRTATHTIRGRNVGALYRRLEPYLAGRYTQKQLLAAVPTGQATAVRSLLSRLEEKRLLRSDECVERPEPDGGVRIALDGRAVPDDPKTLAFLPADVAGAWLLRVDPRSLQDRWICIVVVPETADVLAPSERIRRMRYARWLLGTLREEDAARRSEARVYTLSDNGILTLQAHIGVDAGCPPLSSLAEQLRLVRGASVDQLPLVVATASHSYLRPVVTRYGLRFVDVEHAALIEFLAECILNETPETSSQDNRRHRMAIADSPTALEARLIEDAAASELVAHSPCDEVDLLRLHSAHPDVGYLQRVLRLRSPVMPVLRHESPEGIVLLRCPRSHLSAVSLIPEKASAELLMRVVWKEFYPAARVDGEPTPACSYAAFVTEVVLRERVDRLRPTLAGGTLRWQELSAWGMTAWVGRLLR